MTRGLGVQVRSVLRVLGMRRPLVWIACPAAAHILDGLREAAGVVYQYSDCYTALQNGDACAVGDLERRIAQRADLVICSSILLHERARRLYGQGEYVDHGVDFALFDSARDARVAPPELAGLRRPIAGFFGNMDGNTVDRRLLEEVVRLRPQYSFALVGRMAADFESLRKHRNVVSIPQQPYRRVPQYGAAFDVCLMPWLRNEWIAHCNPVKLKEYLALGKPIVSTSFPELRRCEGLCYEADTPGEFAAAIDRALAEDSPARQGERREWAARHTWDVKFERVLELLEARGIRTDGRVRADDKNRCRSDIVAIAG